MIDDNLYQKKVKMGVFIFLGIIVLVVLVGVIINFSKFSSFLNPTYLIVDNDLVWKKENNKWIDAEVKDVINKFDFKIYYNKNNYVKGKVKIYGSDIYVKSGLISKYEKKDIEAAIANGNIKLADSHKTSIDLYDDNTANTIFIDSLNDNERQHIYYSYSDRIFGERIKTNINNTNQKSYIYVLNSLTKDSTSFSYSNISLVTSSKVTTIINSTSYYYEVKKIIDLDNDNKYEIIVKKAKYKDSTDYCYELYKEVDGKYENIKSCNLD